VDAAARPLSVALPEEFRSRVAALEAALGTGLLDALQQRPRPVFRVNRLRTTQDAVLRDPVIAALSPAPVEGLPATFHVAETTRSALTASEPVSAGAIHVQNPSSQRAARLLGARPDERVLDLAAAPGGKTLVLAELMDDRGELVAVEPVAARFHKMRELLQRGNATCVRTVRADGRRLARHLHGTFDRVLLDAPCSSEARFAQDPEQAERRWSLQKIRDMTSKQWGLLGTAFACLREGGELVYATCSFAPEENEQNVAALLRRHPGEVELLPVDVGAGVTTVPGLCAWGKKRWPEELAMTRRIVPDALHEGFFVARLRRR